MPRLKALRELRYGGVTIRPGEEFEASDKEARIHKAVGLAEDAPERKKVIRRAMQPAPAALPDRGQDDDLPASGVYARRDMRAED